MRVSAEDPQPALLPVIMRIVSEAFKIGEAQMLTHWNNQHVSAARKVAMYLMRSLAKAPWMAMARYLGRDHSTCIHGYQATTKRMEAEPAYAAFIHKLERQIKEQAEATHATEP